MKWESFSKESPKHKRAILIGTHEAQLQKLISGRLSWETRPIKLWVFFFIFFFFLSIFIFRMVEGQIAFENKVFNVFLIHKNVCHCHLNLLSLILIFCVSHLPIFMLLNKGEGFVVDFVLSF